MSNEKEIAERVANILKKLAKKIEENPDLLNDLELNLGIIPTASRKKKKKELPIDFDVFQIFSDGGEQILRQKLELLEVKTLIRIIRQHGYDSSKLAEKWKNKERLVNLILERVAARNDKGKVFKNYK